MHAWLKFEGYSSKNEAATPLRSSKLKWAWRAQFLSHNLQILWKFIFFESLQMIVKPSLAISNSIEFGKKWSSPPSMCKGVLGLAMIPLTRALLRIKYSTLESNRRLRRLSMPVNYWTQILRAMIYFSYLSQLSLKVIGSFWRLISYWSKDS